MHCQKLIGRYDINPSEVIFTFIPINRNIYLASAHRGDISPKKWEKNPFFYRSKTEVVQVEGTSAQLQVDTSRQTVDGVVTAQQIVQLPLNQRNFLDHAALQPA
jgi:hypothetical protein